MEFKTDTLSDLIVLYDDDFSSLPLEGSIILSGNEGMSLLRYPTHMGSVDIVVYDGYPPYKDLRGIDRIVIELSGDDFKPLKDEYQKNRKRLIDGEISNEDRYALNMMANAKFFDKIFSTKPKRRC